MKTISSLYFLIITVVLFGAVRLQAQTSSFTFSCASWDRIVGDPIHYLAGKPIAKNATRGGESSEDRMKRLKQIDVPEMTRSFSYEFKTGRTIGFFRKSTNAEGEVTLTMVNGKRQWLQRNTLTYKPTKYLIYFFYSEKDRWGKLKLESKGIVAFKPPPVPTEQERERATSESE